MRQQTENRFEFVRKKDKNTKHDDRHLSAIRISLIKENKDSPIIIYLLKRVSFKDEKIFKFYFQEQCRHKQSCE